MEGVTAARDKCLTEARAASTRATYSVGLTAFRTLGKLLHWNLHSSSITPKILSDWVSLFIGWLVQRQLSYGTIRVYVYGVAAYFKDRTCGEFDPLTKYPVIMCLQGARRILKDSPKQKLAFEMDFLRDLYPLLDLKTYINARDFAALVVCFFGLFRKSELVAITWSNVQILDEGVRINVPISKTDKFGKGVGVLLASRNDNICPRKALLHLASLSSLTASSGSSPVFCSAVGDGKPKVKFSSSAFVKRLKKCIALLGFDPSDFSGHSPRRGGATANTKLDKKVNGYSPFLLKIGVSLTKDRGIFDWR